MSEDRNFARCQQCGALFENPGERFTLCPAHREDLYPQLLSEVQELLACYDAGELIRKGFIGMGKNILQEKAGRFKYQIRRVRKLVERT